MKTKIELKTELKARVSEKIENTRARLAYKAGTPTSEPAREGRIRSFWWKNGDLKEIIRAIGLAYALVRGQPYWVVERRCRETPDAGTISAYSGATLEDVESWLATKPTETELEAWQEHLDLVAEKERLRRAARPARSAA